VAGLFFLSAGNNDENRPLEEVGVDGRTVIYFICQYTQQRSSKQSVTYLLCLGLLYFDMFRVLPTIHRESICLGSFPSMCNIEKNLKFTFVLCDIRYLLHGPQWEAKIIFNWGLNTIKLHLTEMR
jgi:hypothetical protein